MSIVFVDIESHIKNSYVKHMKAKINFYATKVGHYKNLLDFIGSVSDDVRKYFFLLQFYILLLKFVHVKLYLTLWKGTSETVYLELNTDNVTRTWRN